MSVSKNDMNLYGRGSRQLITLPRMEPAIHPTCVCVCVCTPFLLYRYYDVDSSTHIACRSSIPHVENRAYPKSQSESKMTELLS